MEEKTIKIIIPTGRVASSKNLKKNNIWVIKEERMKRR